MQEKEANKGRARPLAAPPVAPPVTGRPHVVVAALAYRQLNILENATAYGILRQGAGIWNANSGLTHST